ncbi:hypothetical protein PR001_g1191 [Phytophthora rubi]|uniref:Uncharacterized protein n=1 Tax=Phytophthora rubi TaxID=129364 RepID=A0A6A3PG89_9STRA|nr:hypothetical protein PR001_g1191 [Phytophthora rubi]
MARWIIAVLDDMPPYTIRNGFRKADFIDRENASQTELHVPQEADKDDDVVALLEESGLLDLDVGVIDSDDDFDL